MNAELEREPSLVSSLSPEAHGHLAHALPRTLRRGSPDAPLGFDPAAPGVDGSSALHAACWVGNVNMVEQLMARGGVPVNSRDPAHGSTPLGWAAFGSAHRRARGADYVAVIDRLVAAGADVTAAGDGDAP